MSSSSAAWRVWIDVGGTFTDCLAVEPGGRSRRAKVLSSGALRGRVAPRRGRESVVSWSARHRGLPSGFFAGCRLVGPEGALSIVDSDLHGSLELDRAWIWGERECEIRSPDGAAVLAARLVTGSAHGRPLPPCEIRFATTHGTNALLERHGDPPVLFTTRGLGDLLEIGTQQRPELFALAVEKPAPLHGRVVEVDERLAADGSVLEAMSLSAVEEAARAALADGARSAAVALLHSYRNGEHEERLTAALEKLGFGHVSTSSSLSPRIKLVPRARAAVVDAYLSGVIATVLGRIREHLASGSLVVMTSAGGLVRADLYRAKDSLLSGPAAGVIGAVAAGERSGEERVLAFDMGGTSTDVARYDGRLEYVSETTVGEATLASPSLAVETVAAGGGSICRFDGRQLKVGPESVGAEPGPACYGRGGALSLTDVNLLLGRLVAEHFPFRLDRVAAETAAAEIVENHGRDLGDTDRDRLLSGFLQIANEKMAGAVRAISLAAGFRPHDYALVTFGGAGPQHACGLAELLGIRRVVVPADAALLSAAGLGHARLERFAERQVLAPLTSVAGKVASWFERLADEARVELAREGVAAEDTEVVRREVFLRLAGQDAVLAVDWTAGVDLEHAYLEVYFGHFGYRPTERDVEIESLRLVARERGGEEAPAEGDLPPAADAVAGEGSQPMWTPSGWIECPVVERRLLAAGQTRSGPLLVVEANSVTVVDLGWRASLDAAGALRLERGEA